ncbi:hypothetical protein XENOCAPTIV_028681 [Xenoophorus captivus]|uniref:BAR domain-containing protein n=1 Tax=Xenoophorus captivus TaxID=1517983 RepID=A0ABV0QY17_9TELE
MSGLIRVFVFICVRDVRKFKDTKKHFDRVREDMEIAQVKNAQAPRNKPHEVEEATSSLSVTRNTKLLAEEVPLGLCGRWSVKERIQRGHVPQGTLRFVFVRLNSSQTLWCSCTLRKG